MLSKTATRIHCANCNVFLTMPPLIRSNNGFICERCKKGAHHHGRLEVYQKLEQLINSPCCYKNEGCSMKLWEILEKHEEFCNHRLVFPCPLQKCTWRGPSTFFVEHFRQYHRQDLLLKPVYSSIPQNRSISENKLLAYDEHDGDLFIVHRESDLCAGKFWYGVCYIGEPKEAQQYTFVVELCGANSKKTAEIYNRNNTVGTNMDFEKGWQDMIEFDIEALKTLLEDNNILCKVFIELRDEDDAEEQEAEEEN